MKKNTVLSLACVMRSVKPRGTDSASSRFRWQAEVRKLSDCVPIDDRSDFFRYCGIAAHPLAIGDYER